MSEQKCIVATLDEAFEAIDTAAENTYKSLKDAQDLLKNYRREVFSLGSQRWSDNRLGEVCQFVRGPFGGSLKKASFVPDGYAVYEQQHAIHNQFEDVRYFIDGRKFKEMQRFELYPNDLIMSCSGTMGRVAVVPGSIRRGIINQALLKLTPNPSISADFLRSWMESNSFQEALKKRSGGAAIQNVASVKTLKEIDVPVPSIEEQERVVRRLDAFGEKVSLLEISYLQKIEVLAELKQAVLQSAFAGKLAARTVGLAHVVAA